MGQTLTHGVYLPDEGERNCYSGLAANWQILDTSVGTIAAHTAALAGKASAVHTHTKSDITDFPAYGTTAGTICEGNDSRLSDARTPVEHTHTKSDVTDLFNSANTWSANNTFSAGAYFYNSDSTAATSTLNLRNSKVTKGGASDNGSQIIQFLDKDNKFLSQIITTKASSGTTQLQFTLGNIDGNNNPIIGGITLSLAIDGTKQLIPGSNKTHNLGNSSYQWKTLNGVNPGALSLPDTYINLDTKDWDLTGQTFTYVSSIDGWLFINVRPNNNYAYVAIEAAHMRNNSENTTGKNAMACIAVRATVQTSITLIGASIAQARLVKCAGNV